MALRFIDSFDHYDDAQLGNKYNVITNSPAITTGGRFGTNCLFLLGTSSPRQVTKILDSQSTWIVGFAVQHNEVSQGTSTRFLRWMSGGSDILDVRRASNASWQIFRNNSTFIGGTSAFLSNDTWYYLELKVFFSTTVGTFELRMNGNVVASGTNANTGGSSADRLMLSGIQQTGSVDDCLIDDLYICDGTGSAPTNDFLGDIRVECLFPNANGNSSTFVGSDGNSTDNYLLVDETSGVNDADYVGEALVGAKDTYGYTNLTPAGGIVYGVQPVTRAAKTDAGARSMCSVARLSGTETDSANKALSTSVAYYPDIRETKPGGGAWTVSDVNSAEFGQKVTV